MAETAAESGEEGEGRRATTAGKRDTSPGTVLREAVVVQVGAPATATTATSQAT